MVTPALRAEYRKLVATRLWWLLLIPTLVVTYLISILGAAIAVLPDNETIRELGGRFPSLLGVSLTYSVAFTSLLTMCLGINSSAGEVRHQTITTTYLTTKGRGTVLAAKMLVYAVLGLLYGVVIMITATLGGFTVGGWSAFPPVAQFLGVAIVGTVVLALWTVAGVGIGTLIPNQVIALVGALVTRLVAENIASLVLRRIGAGPVADVLPGAASSTFSRSLATDFAIGLAPLRTQANFEDLLSGGALSWWAGGLVFALWVLACCLGGWLTAERRDVR